jgi:GMP synthase (glutamine-hydrolysing)
MPVKRALALRHVAFEDLGCLETVLEDRGWSVEYSAAWAAAETPEPDLLIVLGGPIGAYEEDKYPFVAGEIAWIERRLASGRPVLGLCLGAQMMARALGARVYGGAGKEIGWAPLRLTAEGLAGPLAVLDGIDVLHWHGDTFDLPSGAIRLASTPLYANQAFAWGPRALALQFHAEVKTGSFEAWLVGHACELSQAGIDVAQLRREAAAKSSVLEACGKQLFRDWLDKAEL